MARARKYRGQGGHRTAAPRLAPCKPRTGDRAPLAYDGQQVSARHGAPNSLQSLRKVATARDVVPAVLRVSAYEHERLIDVGHRAVERETCAHLVVSAAVAQRLIVKSY